MNASKVLLFVFVIAISLVNAQSSSKNLLTDLVDTAGGKFTTASYAQVKNADGEIEILEINATAPSKGLISRDRFVSMYTFLKMEMIKIFSADGKYTALEQITGKPDIDIDLQMTKAGTEILVKQKNGQVNKVTKEW
ncbi:MAG: hypothetical protein KA149_12940 [Chitinophagales bacterium]|nr:hypothetical protein [Chitinophagales bacterium]